MINEHEKLRSDDFDRSVKVFKNFLNTVFKNKEIFRILKTTYQGIENSETDNLIKALTRASTRGFMKKYDSKESQSFKIFTDFIVNFYSEFLMEKVEEFIPNATTISNPNPCFIKLIKLRVIEQTIIRKKM